MKKRFTTLALAMILACSLAIPAGAIATEQEDTDVSPITVDIPEEDVSSISDSVMPLMTTNLLHSRTFSGLNAGYDYQWSEKTFKGSDFSTGTFYFTTNLTTSGSKRTVNVGFAEYSSINDNFGISANQVKQMGLKDSKYFTPKTLKSNGKYQLVLQNETGGVVKGTAQWCDVVN